MKKFLQFAFRLFKRELKAGEFSLIIIALMIAVAALTSINFYTDRVGRALNQQAAELLGADMIVKHGTKIPAEWIKLAHSLKLQTSEQLIYPTMLSNQDHLQLVNVKAIASPFPLRGQLILGDVTKQKIFSYEGVPSSNEIWIDKRLLDLMQLTAGSQVQIGAANFTVRFIIEREPDANASWLSVAPRVLINLQDIAKTQTVVEGSRVEYQLALIGDRQRLREFKHSLQRLNVADEQIIDIKNGRPQFNTILNRATSYINLASLICVILCGVAIATTAYRYTQKQLNVAAILRCIGVTHQQLSIIYSMSLLLIGMMGSIIGCIAGFIIQELLYLIAKHWFMLSLPSVSIIPAVKGIISGVALLFCFSIPSFFNLRQITALHALRRDIKIDQINYLILLLSLVPLIFIFIAYTEDTRLSILFAACLFLTLTLLAITVFGLLKFAQFVGHLTHRPWKYGLLNLAHHQLNTHIQLLSYGAIVMVMALLYLTRTELIEAWLSQLPKNTPNYFVTNLLGDDLNKFNLLLKQAQINSTQIYPIIRGRLVELNHQEIHAAVPRDARNNNALNRELNLTQSQNLPEKNQIIQGQWWNKNERGKYEVSVEESLANNLGIKIGDELGFQIGEQRVSAKVKNIRTVEWDSFKPNFYMIFPEDVFPNAPRTYMTSIYLPAEKRIILNKIIAQFPSVTLIDVDALLKEARQLINKITYALQGIMLFSLLGGIVVFYATLKNSLPERIHDCSIMRIVGAKNSTLRLILSTEFIALGFLAGFLGAVAANITGALIVEQIFGLQFKLEINLWILCAAIGAITIGSIGMLAIRKLLNTSPTILLKNHQL